LVHCTLFSSPCYKWAEGCNIFLPWLVACVFHLFQLADVLIWRIHFTLHSRESHTQAVPTITAFHTRKVRRFHYRFQSRMRQAINCCKWPTSPPLIISCPSPKNKRIPFRRGFPVQTPTWFLFFNIRVLPKQLRNPLCNS